MMNRKIFKSLNGVDLIVKSRKSAVIFETNMDAIEGIMYFDIHFAEDVFKELLEHIETVSSEAWKSLNIKEADSFGCDYDEYYDRQLDNNGYLSIGMNALRFERPTLNSGKLYQFNKAKMGTFIWDFRKVITEVKQ